MRELAVLRLEDHGADDVAGQQVGGELDALELEAERRAEALHQQRLGEAGHALDQHVAVGEQRHQRALDDGVLADDRLLHLAAHPRRPLRAALRRRDVGGTTCAAAGAVDH